MLGELFGAVEASGNTLETATREQVHLPSTFCLVAEIKSDI